MVNQMFTSIAKELEVVYQKIERELIIKSGHIGSFAHLKFSYFDYAIRPALVILSARMFGQITEKTLALASVCQFIYMASQVHYEVSEQDTEIAAGLEFDPRDGSQFPVLVGDFLYGKFFTTLCDYDIVNFLKPLSEIICEIHEGGILRRKQAYAEVSSPAAVKDIIHKETAELFAGCCKLGAQSVRAGAAECSALYKFGKNFGMAYGLLEKGVPLDSVIHYFDQALKEVGSFAKRQSYQAFEKLVNLLLKREVAVCRMVV